MQLSDIRDLLEWPEIMTRIERNWIGFGFYDYNAIYFCLG